MSKVKMLVREIVFKAGKEGEESANEICKILDKQQKVLGTNIRDGKRIIVARFDDGMDLMAFMVATGMATMEVLPDGGKE